MVTGYSVHGSHQTCGYFDLALCDVVWKAHVIVCVNYRSDIVIVLHATI